MKKTLKKMLCGVCSAAMLLGAVTFSASAAAAFTDVKPTDYFAKPVEWAFQNGITAGVSDTQFGPYQSCTRAQAMTFLWAAAGRPDPTASANFSDVKSTDYFAKAVAWAVENGITAGVGGGKFGPNQTCTRGQIMTMLWRADQIDAPVVPEPEKPTEPAPTEPEVTEPAPTEPAPTEPAPTEPEVTEPTHEHKWEYGAYEKAFVCQQCGWTCTASQAHAAGMDLGGYWDTYHQYSEDCDASYDTDRIWIPNSPYADRKICTDCGEEVMDSSHSSHVHEWQWIESQGYWFCESCEEISLENPEK